MFKGCSKLSVLSDISKWDTTYVTNMSSIFEECRALISLPDISKWNTTNVNDMSNLFKDYDKLISLPDISKWNVNVVYNMKGLFSGCKNLKSLPDISKLSLKNVINISNMFYDCSSLTQLPPDISKWETTSVKNMSFLFYGCSSLEFLPDISNWSINNVEDISYMFSCCSSLRSLPKISKWKTSNIIDMEGLFQECKSLNSIPDIYKWDLRNVNDISYLFNGCSSLNNIPIFKNVNNNMVLYSSLFNNNDKFIIFYSMEQVEDNIKIFGKTFVKNNKNKCKIIFNNKKYKLTEEFFIGDLDIDVFYIILTDLQNISDFSYMFYGCNNLLKIFRIKDEDDSDIVNELISEESSEEKSYLDNKIYYDFVCEISLNNNSETIKEPKNNITNLSNMFAQCELLESLCDFPYSTGNVVDISYMFNKCLALKSLPDNISKWNTSKIKDMSYLIS